VPSSAHSPTRIYDARPAPMGYLGPDRSMGICVVRIGRSGSERRLAEKGCSWSLTEESGARSSAMSDVSGRAADPVYAAEVCLG
jgi:hypothetical protein